MPRTNSGCDEAARLRGGGTRGNGFPKRDRGAGGWSGGTRGSGVAGDLYSRVRRDLGPPGAHEKVGDRQPELSGGVEWMPQRAQPGRAGMEGRPFEGAIRVLSSPRSPAGRRTGVISPERDCAVL